MKRLLSKIKPYDRMKTVINNNFLQLKNKEYEIKSHDGHTGNNSKLAKII